VLEAGFVQAQYSGQTGFGHNEINPDREENRALQMWFLPQAAEKAARYDTVKLEPRGVVRVFDNAPPGGERERTWVEVALLGQGQQVAFEGEYLAYLATGEGVLNGQSVFEGDLIRGTDAHFDAKTPGYLVLVRASVGSAPAAQVDAR
jgi:hypothetical protein